MASVAVPYDGVGGPALGFRESEPELLLPVAPNLFVVPAYDEAENIPRLLADLESRPALFPAGSCLIVVDDGSEDGTADLIDGYSGPLTVEVVRLARNQGPGAAFRAGFTAALARWSGEALIVTLEADTTSDLDCLPLMLDRAAAGADLVLASWAAAKVSHRRRLLTAGAAFFVRRTLGVEAHTVSSFFRVYRASALRAALERYGSGLIRETGFACKAELLAKLAALEFRIEEVPVPLDTSRRIGKSKMPILRTVIAYWRMAVRQRAARGAIPA